MFKMLPVYVASSSYYGFSKCFLSLKLIVEWTRHVSCRPKTLLCLQQGLRNRISLSVCMSGNRAKFNCRIIDPINWNTIKLQTHQSRKIVVLGMNLKTKFKEVKKQFLRCGKILNISLMREKGFCFITYRSIDEASCAVECFNNSILCRRQITVAFSNTVKRASAKGGFCERKSKTNVKSWRKMNIYLNLNFKVSYILV